MQGSTYMIVLCTSTRTSSNHVTMSPALAHNLATCLGTFAETIRRIDSVPVNDIRPCFIAEKSVGSMLQRRAH